MEQTLVRYGTHPNSWLCSATASRGYVSIVLDTVSARPTIQNGQAIYEAQALGLHGSGAEHFSRCASRKAPSADAPRAPIARAKTSARITR